MIRKTFVRPEVEYHRDVTIVMYFHPTGSLHVEDLEPSSP